MHGSLGRAGIALALAVALTTSAAPVGASDCSKTSVGLTPLSDLGTGRYQGVEGGLYGERAGWDLAGDCESPQCRAREDS